MPTITKRQLRAARKKRAEHKRKMMAWITLLGGACFIVLATGLSFYFSEDSHDAHAGMRCVQLQENEEGFEECIRWEREKTYRSKIVGQETR